MSQDPAQEAVPGWHASPGEGEGNEYEGGEDCWGAKLLGSAP